jgi:hypothetical protein
MLYRQPIKVLHRASLVALPRICDPERKNISHPSLVMIYFVPIPPIKWKLGLQMGERLLTANPLD